MPARDDSVVRGGLIACAIFLVISLVVNFLLWNMADTASTQAENASSQLTEANNSLTRQQEKIQYYEGAIGVSNFTEAEMKSMAERGADDATFQQVVNDLATAMSYFGPEVDPSQKNLTALPTYLTEQIRTLSDQYNNAVQAQQQEKARADAEIKLAQDAQAVAEQLQKKSEDEKEALRAQFEDERQAMKLAGGQLRDQLRTQQQNYAKVIQGKDQQLTALSTQRDDLLATVESQRREINQMRNSQFEIAQGKVTSTNPGGSTVYVDLGSMDALRRGISFAVFDADETRVTDSEPKATIEIVAIRGDHLAEARIVGDPYAVEPIIPGDKVYSPFWAPGRKVRIAVAGTVDVNRDGRANDEDLDILTGVIQAAGAEVAAVVGTGGGRPARSQLDSSIRFLVVGERPEASAGGDAEQTAQEQQKLAEMGAVIDDARQKGITIISADKLIGFLRNIDESITVPLGPTARASDFPPAAAATGRRNKSDVSGFYRRTPPRSN